MSLGLQSSWWASALGVSSASANTRPAASNTTGSSTASQRSLPALAPHGGPLRLVGNSTKRSPRPNPKGARTEPAPQPNPFGGEKAGAENTRPASVFYRRETPRASFGAGKPTAQKNRRATANGQRKTIWLAMRPLRR